MDKKNTMKEQMARESNQKAAAAAVSAEQGEEEVMDKKNTMKEQMAREQPEGGSRGGVGRAGPSCGSRCEAFGG